MGRDEPAQRRRRQRVQILDRAGRARHDRGGELLGAEPDPDYPEVSVARPSLPDPVARDERPQRVRRRAAPLVAPALGLGGGAHGGADAVEVAQELPPGSLDLAAGLAARGHQRAADQGERRDQEERARDPGDRVGPAAGEQVGDRAEPG